IKRARSPMVSPKDGSIACTLRCIQDRATGCLSRAKDAHAPHRTDRQIRPAAYSANDMTIVPRQGTATLAVLIDADNATPAIVEGLLAEVAKYGVAAVKRIYGDWTKPNLAG